MVFALSLEIDRIVVLSTTLTPVVFIIIIIIFFPFYSVTRLAVTVLGIKRVHHAVKDNPRKIMIRCAGFRLHATPSYSTQEPAPASAITVLTF